ncbi:MAG: hypothetical protein AAGN66_24085, partial [Acidobacteriota bacterium]
MPTTSFTGIVTVLNEATGVVGIRIDGDDGTLYLGSGGNDGVLIVRNGVGAEAIRLHGAQAAIDAGGLGLGGALYLREPTGS